MEEQEKLYNQELPTLNEKLKRKSGYPGLRTTRGVHVSPRRSEPPLFGLDAKQGEVH